MLINIREERSQLVEVALSDRIVLVIVAASTFKRQSQERGPVRDDAVGDVGGTKFRFDASPFIRLPMKPVEGGRQLLISRGIREQITCGLLGKELFVGKDCR